MVISALLEVISLGALLPFLGSLVEPEKVYQAINSQSYFQLKEVYS